MQHPNSLSHKDGNWNSAQFKKLRKDIQGMLYEESDNNKGLCSPSLPVCCYAFQHIRGAWKADLHNNILTWITFSVGLPSREVMFLLVSQTTPGPSHPTSPLETVPQSWTPPQHPPCGRNTDWETVMQQLNFL